jgi:hypothetical protein
MIKESHIGNMAIIQLTFFFREWSKVWQKQFNDLGYSTVDAAITLPSLEQDKEPLSSCYQGKRKSNPIKK